MVTMGLRGRAVAVVAAGCCAAGVMVAGLAPAAAASTSGTTFVPLGPVRVMDTRTGIGVAKAPVGPAKTVSLQVTGVDGVPSVGVTAVVLNVTVVGPTANSAVTVYPDGETRPGTSNLNFTRGETIPNLVVAPVGTDGKVDFYNYVGSINLVADLSGYYTDSGGGSLLGSVGPVRMMDTRNGTGVPKAPVGPGQTVSLQVDGVDGLPAQGVTAVVLNVTVVGPTANSAVTVYPDGETRPGTSNLNFTRGETIPNMVIVPVDNGKIDFYNYAGSINLVADLSGYYAVAGATFTPMGPVRMMDTRNGTGVPKAPVGPGQTVSLQVDGVDGLPAKGVTAVVLNVTVVGPTANSAVTVYPDGETRPGTSNLNFTRGETIPNLVVAPVGTDGKVDFYNYAGSVNLVADLSGYYTTGGAPWGNAIQVPGTAALNTGGAAWVNSVSCPTAGNCTVGGSYSEGSGFTSQVFVADEVNGTWHNAIEVPGTAALNTGGQADVSSVSCASAGNCVVGGEYAVTPSSPNSSTQAFVADEVNGTWHNAIEVPGTAALNTGGQAFVSSVSCASAGNCAVGGSYTDGSSSAPTTQAFVANEVNGTWGNAIEVPGSDALNIGGQADVSSVSCGSAGNCAVGGFYQDTSTGFQAFVADEVNGTWDDALEIPGTAALNTGDQASVSSVSCASAGNCTAVGGYSPSISNGPNDQVFVASEVNGTWGNAIEIPGTAALNTGNIAFVSSVSCPSAGNCAIGGQLAIGSVNSSQPFVVSEVNGTWGDAIQIPVDAPGNGGFESVSCPSVGNCVAGGIAGALPGPTTGSNQAFVVSEVNGTWGQGTMLPGILQLFAQVFSVSCPPTGSCTAAGGYQASSSPASDYQTFVASQN